MIKKSEILKTEEEKLFNSSIKTYCVYDEDFVLNVRNFLFKILYFTPFDRLQQEVANILNDSSINIVDYIDKEHFMHIMSIYKYINDYVSSKEGIYKKHIYGNIFESLFDQALFHRKNLLLKINEYRKDGNKITVKEDFINKVIENYNKKDYSLGGIEQLLLLDEEELLRYRKHHNLRFK